MVLYGTQVEVKRQPIHSVPDVETADDNENEAVAHEESGQPDYFPFAVKQPTYDETNHYVVEADDSY